MPISARDGCSTHHWRDVLDILTAAANEAGYEANLVSNSEHIGVIQQTIVDNLHDNPIVVCDVSSENPNVMFELGLRLAFDKPTVVVVDDKTKIQFDTSPIEHLKYPRDLRFSSIVKFKSDLAGKIKATVQKFDDPNFPTFLRSFKRFTAAKLESTELPRADLILKELESIRRDLNRQHVSIPSESHRSFPTSSDLLEGPIAEILAAIALQHLKGLRDEGDEFELFEAVDSLKDNHLFKGLVPEHLQERIAIDLISAVQKVL